jgi:hypothetical protein
MPMGQPLWLPASWHLCRKHNAWALTSEQAESQISRAHTQARDVL